MAILYCVTLHIVILPNLYINIDNVILEHVLDTKPVLMLAQVRGQTQLHLEQSGCQYLAPPDNRC